MSLLEFPIRRYPFTLIVFLCLAVLGWFAFTSIPREEDPYFKIPGVLHHRHLSRARIRRTSSAWWSSPSRTASPSSTTCARWRPPCIDGVAVIAIEFEADADADKKYDEVTREVNALRPDAAAATSRSSRSARSAPGLVNIVQLALVSEDAPYRELEDYARELKDTLKTVDGIRTAESWAYPAARAARRGGPEAHGRARPHARAGDRRPCRARTPTFPPASIDLGPRSFSLKTSGSYTSLDEVRDTVVAVGGRPHRARARHRAA